MPNGKTLYIIDISIVITFKIILEITSVNIVDLQLIFLFLRNSNHKEALAAQERYLYKYCIFSLWFAKLEGLRWARDRVIRNEIQRKF